MSIFLTEQINIFFQQNFFWQNVAIFAAVYAIWILGLIYLLVWWHKSSSREGLLLSLMIVGLVYAIDFIIGYIFFESRPFVTGVSKLLITAPTFSKSFPSDHAALAMVISLSLIRLNKKWWWVLFLALFIALGRVAVGVHYLHDVLAGLGSGFLATWLVDKVYSHLWDNFHLFKKNNL